MQNPRFELQQAVLRKLFDAAGRNAEKRVAELMPRTKGRREQSGQWYGWATWLFAGHAVTEMVATRVRFNASPEAVWNHFKFFEEVPGPRPLLLRAMLPEPVRTEGDKTQIGATVRCEYTRGDLVKRITAVEAPHFLEFEVIEQRLGIEGCMLAVGGSYQVYACGDATDVVLSTKYQAYLRPRFLWRHLEALLLTQLHGHILRGMRGSVQASNPAICPAVGESPTHCAPTGGAACTTSRSRFRP